MPKHRPTTASSQRKNENAGSGGAVTVTEFAKKCSLFDVQRSIVIWRWRFARSLS